MVILCLLNRYSKWHFYKKIVYSRKKCNLKLNLALSSCIRIVGFKINVDIDIGSIIFHGAKEGSVLLNDDLTNQDPRALLVNQPWS